MSDNRAWATAQIWVQKGLCNPRGGKNAMTQGGGAGDLEIGRAVVLPMANKTRRRLANKAPV